MANDGIITATLDVYVTERGAYKNTEAHAPRNLRKPPRR